MAKRKTEEERRVKVINGETYVWCSCWDGSGYLIARNEAEKKRLLAMKPVHSWR